MTPKQASTQPKCVQSRVVAYSELIQHCASQFSRSGIAKVRSVVSTTAYPRINPDKVSTVTRAIIRRPNTSGDNEKAESPYCPNYSPQDSTWYGVTFHNHEKGVDRDGRREHAASHWRMLVFPRSPRLYFVGSFQEYQGKFKGAREKNDYSLSPCDRSQPWAHFTFGN